MTEERSRGPLAGLLIVGLAFVVILLWIRLNTVNEELDAARQERDVARTNEVDATRLASGLEDALDASQSEMRV